MDAKKQVLLNSVIDFLKGELTDSSLDEEKKESLEVAIQCLETTFQVDSQNNGQKVDLLSLINIKSKAEITDDQRTQAEVHKNKGNNFMKNSEYKEAVDEYSKAIELDPYNAVYYCNRAAAYTRLSKDLDVINDCNEAIKLNPSYGKAYGRLGIAYTNLNKFEQAIVAYQTALKYEPADSASYSIYETNLKLAQERLRSNTDGASQPSLDPRQFPDNLRQFMSDPNVANLAAQILNDENFHQMMTGIMTNLPAGRDGGVPAAMQSVLQAGHAAIQRARTENPNLLRNVARDFWSAPQNQESSENAEPKPDSKDQSSDKKDQGST